MSQHDKHQYYFERYLRNEMPTAERDVFDAKLADDASLRMALEYYRLNRDKLLSDLIQEHKIIRRDNRFNKLIFLLISLTGIALTFNYFVYRQPASSNSKGKAKENIFVRYIPFLGREPKPDPKPATPSTAAPSAPKTKSQPEKITPLEPSPNRDERLSSDIFQRDTFVTIIDKATADLLATYLTKQHDSLATDSLTPPTIIKNSKSQMMLVEYWESPFGFKGYFLQKNTLVLYGIQQRDIILYRDQDQVFVHIPGQVRMLITEQPKFTSF